jgi:hypothetical protein
VATRLRDLHVWLEPAAFQRLAAAAEVDHRSPANLARALILRGLGEPPVIVHAKPPKPRPIARGGTR